MTRKTVDLQKVPWKLYPLLGVKIIWPEDIDIDEFLKQDECIVEIEVPEYESK